MADTSSRRYLIMNLLCGLSAVGVWSIAAVQHPAAFDQMWSGMPRILQSVFFGMAGLSIVSHGLLLGDVSRVPSGKLTRKGMPVQFELTFVSVCLLLTLIWWPPLCLAALNGPRPELMSWIQLVVMVGGAAALLQASVIWRLDNPAEIPTFRRMLIAASAVMVQCTILNAFVWPRFFVLAAVP